MQVLENKPPEACEAPNSQKQRESLSGHLKYLALGMIFGIIFIKAEIVSWYRIQEMFLFDNFHMYGVIGSAVITGALSVYLIKRFNIKTIHGEKVVLKDKVYNHGQIYGGLIFGLGWAVTGACPGPLYAQLGAGYLSINVSILSAIAGVWVYGRFRDKLPS
ncbi:YeeE/YedE family protein [Jiulongibacter sp. NS-SX5]|uniref:YeeE/YedE family protein n=1 Tax=Jiulongibacter sp. NS-SX5 TaxID=3463854 RepID=UPI004057E852